MLISGVVTQPYGSSILIALANVARTGGYDKLDVAAAYVTTGGARDLLREMRKAFGPSWASLDKRWIFAFDYCRSEPLALEMMRAEPKSAVRIHNGRTILESECIPRIPFHPKAFIFRGAGKKSLFAGSGNISRSGLNSGHEVGLLLGLQAPEAASEAFAKAHMDSVIRWYETVWTTASVLTPQLLSSYQEIFESKENIAKPSPTEDDVSPPPTLRGLTPQQLVKLRVCRNFWIEAGNITKNLGPGTPGNQLMMKRLSRVFFGVPAIDVPQNSPLTTLAITYKSFTKFDCSLTFSDNGMDKLTLPIPGHGGPAAYDQETLLFTRIGPGKFTLELLSTTKKRSCIAASRNVDALFAMSPSGRRWGVF